ncbi:MAG: hypothetical protein ABI955_14070, partial [Nitrospirota bacterium]
FQIGQEFRGLALQGGDKFCSHKVILKYHHARCKRFEANGLAGQHWRLSGFPQWPPSAHALC